MTDDATWTADAIRACRRCDLVNHCKAPVPFYGPVPASIVIVGEAPGEQEDQEGQPFIGPAGQLIRTRLKAAGINPNDCGWVNTVSCFPNGSPSAPTPTDEHVKACEVNKLAQLDLLQPRFVLLLGNVALRGFRPDLSISQARGKPFYPLGHEFTAMATYHPSAALRNGVYETGLVDDLYVFSSLTKRGGPGYSDTCFHCKAPAGWWEPDGVALCIAHEPADAQERRKLLKLEHAEASNRITQGLGQ